MPRLNQDHSSPNRRPKSNPAKRYTLPNLDRPQVNGQPKGLLLRRSVHGGAAEDHGGLLTQANPISRFPVVITQSYWRYLTWQSL